MPDMSERVSKLEGQIGGLEHGHHLLLGGLGLIAGLVAIVLVLAVYTQQKVDQVGTEVSALPGKMSFELRDITKTLAQSITAAKQAPPQVIFMQAPAQQPPAAQTPKP